jgi:predicted Zn-dependent peptidase
MAHILAVPAFLAASLLAVTAPAQAPGASGRILPFDAAERTLPNGLRVIVVPTGFPNIVSLQIPVQTGSRNEVEPGKSGFAHFFEHMMFRGTKAFPPEAYQAILTKAGARQNAFTSDDFTNYHTTFAREDLETILKVEADRFQNLDYSLEAFKTESRAVLGEYNKNSANPIQKLVEVQRENAFKVHTYRHTTMGFLKDIEDMPNQFEYSKVFFDRWYRPEYTTVIVAGDVKADEVLPLVEKYWGPWKAGTYKVDVPVEPQPSGPVVAHVPWTAPTLPWVSVAFRLPAFTEASREWAALDVLSDLTFGPTSALYKSLVEDEQKVTDGGSSANTDPYLLTSTPGSEAGPLSATDPRAFAKPARAAGRAVGREGQPPLALRSLDNTESIAAPRALRALSPFLRHDWRALPHLRRGDARGHPGGGTPLLRGRRARADDAREGGVARGGCEARLARIDPGRGPGTPAAGPAAGAGAQAGAGRECRRGRELRAARPALESAAAQREAAVPGGLRQRPEGQAGPGRARGRDDRRRRVAGDDDRRDQEGALPDGGEPGHPGGQGADQLHRPRPPRQLGALRRGRAAPARGARLPRGGLPALQTSRRRRSWDLRTNKEELGEAAAGARVPGHAVRAPGARHHGRHRRHHARRRQDFVRRASRVRHSRVGLSGDLPRASRRASAGRSRAWPKARRSRRPRASPAARSTGSRSRSSRRRRARARSRSATRSP